MANIRKQRLSRVGSVDQSDEQLIAALEAFLGAQELANAKLCVGLSGGVDSVVLLHLLSRCCLPLTLTAVHVNHGLSPNAQQWSEFAVTFANRLAIDCQVVDVSLPSPRGQGIEAIARQARYAVYHKQDCDAMVLGHHQDDQAETLLLQLMRGSGVVGLSAMLASRHLENKVIIRPLLTRRRADILAYAKRHCLSWVEDESNAETHYQRNFIRHDILPRLESRYPQAKATLNRAAIHFAQTSTLLSELAAMDCPSISEGRPLPYGELRALSIERQRNALYWYLRRYDIKPDENLIIQLQQALSQAARDKMPTFTYQDKTIFVAQGTLSIVPTFTPPAGPITITWQGEAEIAVPAWRGHIEFIVQQGKGIKKSALTQLTFTRRQEGARLLLGPGRPHQTVKNLWQAHRIPLWQRQRLPFVWCDQQLLWVPGAGLQYIDHIAADEEGVVLKWRPWDFSTTT